MGYIHPVWDTYRVVSWGMPWDQRYQILEEVFIEVQCHLERGSRTSNAACRVGMWSWLLGGVVWILKDKLVDSTITNEGTWTLEDRKMVNIVLTKTKRNSAKFWTSLLEFWECSWFWGVRPHVEKNLH